jgi:hypothetical protein
VAGEAPKEEGKMNINLELDKFLEPSLITIKTRLQEELNKHALRIVEEEVSKWALSLTQYMSWERIGNSLVITVRKELK